jgi:RNA recognition motif-containing protein
MNQNTMLVRLHPERSSEEISDETLASIVSQFGPVREINIVRRQPELYFYVEFQWVHSSRDALDFLDGFIENIGWIKTMPTEVGSQYLSVKSLANGQINNLGFSPSGPDVIGGRKNISDPLRTDDQSKNTNHTCSSDASDRRLVCHHSYKSESRFPSLNFSNHENDFGKDTSTLKTATELINKNPEKQDQPTILSRESLNSQSHDSQYLAEKSLFVQIHNLNPRLLNQKVITNLACCFGNALRVYINVPKGIAIIRYRSPKDADRAMLYLHEQTFFGSKLKLLHATPESINPSTLVSTDPSLKAFDFKPPDFRFKNSLKVKFNAPSPILHLTNLSENCTPQILFQILQSIHEPCRIFKLAMKSVNSTNMMLVEFRSVEESREVLALLHNKIIDHKSIRISFSHAKLE